MKTILQIGLLSATLAGWYAATGPAIQQTQKYELPATITVQNMSTKSAEYKTKNNALEQIIKTEKIDFSKTFDITTKRYRLIKDEDSPISRTIGKIGSIPTKILLFDYNMGTTPDSERAKAILAMLENDKSISGITVRLGHNRTIYDTWRLFTDEKITKRNSIIPRATIGFLSMLSEPMAELFRADYYNPMTQTVIMYSNIEAVGAHEIGHHQDFQRFSNDWSYTLASTFPPVKLYKEYAASRNANELLSNSDKQQTIRYLFPAFLTYLFAGWELSKKSLQKRKITEHKNLKDIEKQAIETFETAHTLHDNFRTHKDLDKIEAKYRPQVPAKETFRLFIHQNMILAGAIYAYTLAKEQGPIAATSAFAGGMIATDYICDWIGDKLAPYEHEQSRTITSRVATGTYNLAKRNMNRVHHTRINRSKRAYQIQDF